MLSGCGEAAPECGSLGARNTVVKVISDDSNNALVDYAARNSSVVAARVSNANTELEKSAILEKAKQNAAYRLDDTIRTNSVNKARRAVTCTVLLYATVEDATAQKELDFRVEQSADGKISISVSPFQFWPATEVNE
jgi:flagellar basal body-associated protein FliL